jgi:menaquinone-dependent protoporphyrinogen oxidase
MRTTMTNTDADETVSQLLKRGDGDGRGLFEAGHRRRRRARAGLLRRSPMSRALIVFGTTDGQTAKIAGVLADDLRSCGLIVRTFDAAVRAPSPEGFDMVVVAASVHARGYQRSVQKWTRTHAATLNRMPTAFVSVCLGVLQHDSKVDRELDRIIHEFLASTGWKPSSIKIVAGALKYTRYGLFKRWAMKRIVAKAGGDIDTSRDYEYTDWEDLRQFAGVFAGVAQATVRTHTA